MQQIVQSSRLSPADRIAMLREQKLEETRRKIALFGHMDEDDYGTVVPPEDFRWAPTANHPNGCFYGAEGWGRNFRSLMECYPAIAEPPFALAGRCVLFMPRLRAKMGPAWHPDYSFDHLRGEQEMYGIIPGIGADAHFAGDYRIGLALGWGGLLRKVRHYRTQHDHTKAAFYQAEEDAILGIQNWVGRLAAAARAAAARESRPELAEDMRLLADINEWLIEHPPRTFREACQWIAHFNVASRTYNRDGAGGQLDELLRPYYERDTAAGILDDETAMLIIASLLLIDTRYYQIGGPDEHGRDQCSRVSELILEAAHRLKIPANITFRVHEGMDRELFRRSVRYIVADRKAYVRYSGDRGLVEGFCRNGFPPELARQRIATGCQWMAIPGREYTLNDCVKINVAKVFETALWDVLDNRGRTGAKQASDGAGAEFRGACPDGGGPSVAQIWSRFEHHLRKAVLCTARGLDWHLDHQKHNEPELLLNLLCYGPIEKGLDASDGGVEFYNMCIDGAGLATVADSLAAMEQRIEREKALSWDALARHLRDNFAGAEGARVRMMLRSSERYGAGGSLGDRWAVRVSRLFSSLVKESPTPGGRNLIPGWFSWSNTISMGRVVGATPNGRPAGAPISHGCNPDPGFRADAAPTALATAIAEIQCGWGNTCPVQLELDGGFGDDGDVADMVAALIETHFQQGGTLFNINIVDADTLRRAHENPAAYPDLVVRVTGFTAYFASLSREFRQLVIDRLIDQTASEPGEPARAPCE